MPRPVGARRGGDGRLTERPGPAGTPAGPGVHRLEAGGVLLAPETVPDDRPAPLVVALHGAGGDAAHGLAPLVEPAARRGVVLLAPASEGPTWDVIIGGFGRDVATLDHVLEQAFATQQVDAGRVAVGGFSDGASYALSLGLTNGDLFRTVLAFSPGFAAPGLPAGRPGLFVSHGTDDRVLPIDACSRRLVPRLRAAGYEVRYREFAGGHVVPPELAQEGLDWFLDDERA